MNGLADLDGFADSNAARPRSCGPLHLRVREQSTAGPGEKDTGRLLAVLSAIVLTILQAEARGSGSLGSDQFPENRKNLPNKRPIQTVVCYNSGEN
jgi:hypothetical protein